MGTDKQFLGKVFHLTIPQHWDRYQTTHTVHFLRQQQVDDFLENLSYSELLGFLPDDPSNDTYVFAIREANAFRLLCEDPTVFLHDDECWYDPVDSVPAPTPDQERG